MSVPTDGDIELLSRDLAAFKAELEQLNALPRRVNSTPEDADQGLAKLVLSLIEFLRRLLERQAVRRMDAGDLSEEEIERIGLTLMRLEEKMVDLAGQFGLTSADLNLDLGPLGKLL
ncbi:MAG: gas vesicle protein K [Chloroflexota bacterium]